MTRSSPPVCPLCKGSRKLIVLMPGFAKLPEFDPTDEFPSFARMMPGVGYASPRPRCPLCKMRGTLREEEPLGAYPPPPRDDVVDLSPDQSQAIEQILEWFHHSPQKRLSLAGFAGTGKTTIIAELLRQLRGRHVISVCAPTGKAASVLRSKGVFGATTLHKLVYAPETVCTRCFQAVSPVRGFDRKMRCPNCKTTTIKTKWVRVPIVDADLVIVDESSMLNQAMVEDIESLTRKILYVGDHGQLEPIGEDPRIMREPDIRLEQIHRQAEKSGIVQLAHHMRRGMNPQSWDGAFDDARVVGIEKLTPITLSRYDIVLCGYNKTRKAVNTALREHLGFSGSLPQVGERLICLQNDSDLGIFNGLLVTVTRQRQSYELPRYDLIDDAGNEYFDIQIHPEQFAEEKKLEFMPKGIGLFDFGYCLTVHKAQGSEWDNVAVIEQLARGWDPARWRYTAATRAAKRLEYWMPMGRL